MDAFGNPLGTVYGADGNIVKMGDGVITTDANGHALIQNLSPGKYGVSVIPPAGAGMAADLHHRRHAHQRRLGQGRRAAVLRRVRASRRARVLRLRQADERCRLLHRHGQITGRVVNLHNARPPQFLFSPGHPIPERLGRPEQRPRRHRSRSVRGSRQRGQHVHHQQCPRGNLRAGDLGREPGPDLQRPQRHRQRPARCWPWATYRSSTGSPGWRLRCSRTSTRTASAIAGEEGHPRAGGQHPLPGRLAVPVAPTDLEGFVPFDEVFPFFNWLVAEVDYTRFKATGATVVVDGGGPVPPDQGWAYPSRGVLTPQPQFEADGITRPSTPTRATTSRGPKSAPCCWRPSRPSWARPTSSSGARPLRGR